MIASQHLDMGRQLRPCGSLRHHPRFHNSSALQAGIDQVIVPQCTHHEHGLAFRLTADHHGPWDRVRGSKPSRLDRSDYAHVTNWHILVVSVSVMWTRVPSLDRLASSTSKTTARNTCVSQVSRLNYRERSLRSKRLPFLTVILPSDKRCHST